MIELPKDAEGREIPLDTAVLYNKDGNDLHTDRATYMRLTEDWWFFGHFGSHTDTHLIAAADLYLTPPDSWEKLEDDLSEISKGSVCHYFHKGDSSTCEGCLADCAGSCWPTMARDVTSRIRKLRGED